jgi:GAF domain-containing protein
VSIADDVQAIVDGGEEADEILRASLSAVHAASGAPWSAIAFVEEREMIVGPLAGSAPPGVAEPALSVPIVYRGETVAALWFGSETPRELDSDLARVAALLAPYCLVGWDTGGEHWDP